MIEQAGVWAQAWSHFLPSWSVVSLLSLIPVTEYQAAIPVGMTLLKLSAWQAYLASMLGSFVLFFPLFFGLDRLRALLARFVPGLVRPLDMFLERANHKFKDRLDLYGAAALFLALVIPFPLTGIWTATTAAVVFKIDFWPAFWGVIGGAAVGALVVTVITMGAVTVF